jgi:hypothetical protein
MSQANHTKALASQDVGLIFVREYYTFLNKKPSRLYAFYNKDSLFVRGDEGANVTTAKGQDVKCFVLVSLFLYQFVLTIHFIITLY